MPHKPLIAITMGDPAGIGPEIAAKAIASGELFEVCTPVVIGDAAIMKKAVAESGLAVTMRSIGSLTEAKAVRGVLEILDLNLVDSRRHAWGKPDAAAGNAVHAYIKTAVEYALKGEADAITTAPISKAIMNAAGHHYAGHTELLAALTDSKEYGMLFVGGGLRVMLATIHVALKNVPGLITTGSLLKSIRLAHGAMHYFGIEKPRIGVAALNPHAGEGGLFGNEEWDQMLPALVKARQEGIDASDPLPADTLFYKARNNYFDVVIAMYHDQGLAPLKMVAFGNSVNVTVGLPIIRTSVDHGTAYDIAGKWCADPASLLAAVKLAAEHDRDTQITAEEFIVNDRPSEPFLSRSHIFTIAFFGIFLFLLYEMGRLIAPFSADLIWAGIISLALYPLYRRVLTLLRGRAGLTAGIMTLVTLLIVIGPAIALLAVLASQTVDLYQWAAEGISSGAAIEFWQKATSAISQKTMHYPFLAQLDLKGVLIKGLSQFSSSLASQVGTVLKDSLLLVIHLFIMLTVLFFFFKNGENYYRTAMDLFPFSGEQKQAIARKLHDTFTAVINGIFLIALGQGMMTGIGFAVFGVPFPVFWGFLAAILALLPVGGASLVWIPGALYLLISGLTVKGILLALWGIVLVSLPDNFLKPLVIGKKANIPTLFLFLGILGGLQAYGFFGILFGPLIVTLLTAFIQIYRDEFSDT